MHTLNNTECFTKHIDVFKNIHGVPMGRGKWNDQELEKEENKSKRGLPFAQTNAVNQ